VRVIVVEKWVTWQRTDQDDKERQSYLVAALARSGLCMTVQSAAKRYLLITNLFDRWSVQQANEPDDLTIFGDEIARALAALKERVLLTGKTERLELKPDQESVFEFDVQLIYGGSGSPYLLTVIRDLSAKRTAERITLSLLREVSHRSKNLLSIIQSVATQTARHSDTLDAYVKRFRGRLHSLAHAQDLVTDSDWKGAHLQSHVSQQAEKYFPDGMKAIAFEGENIRLSPNASLYLGLALHELIVQAASHRLLAKGKQSILVRCTRKRTGQNDLATLVWHEKNITQSPTDMQVAQRTPLPDFERMLLEKIVPASLNGHAVYIPDDGGLKYEIVFPVLNGA